MSETEKRKDLLYLLHLYCERHVPPHIRKQIDNEWINC